MANGRLRIGYPVAGTYSLSAEAGTYSLSGQSASLIYGQSDSGWQLSAGHFVPAKQAMIQIYPRPDAETSTSARHRWAYYDGVNPVEYRIPIGVAFGAAPYHFEIVTAPTWLSIGQDYGDTDYGILHGTPTTSAAGETVTVRVYDQDLNTQDVTFTLSTSSATTRFIFVDNINGSDAANGAIGTPKASLSSVFGSTFAATANSGAQVYLRGSATSYTLPSYTDNGINPSYPVFEFHTGRKPLSLMAFPGETATLNTSSGRMAAYTSANDFFMQGVRASGFMAAQGNYRMMWLHASRTTFDDVFWTGAGAGTTGDDNATMFFGSQEGANAQYLYLNECGETGRTNVGVNNYGFCSLYSKRYVLIERCSFSGSSHTPFYIKGTNLDVTARYNTITNTYPGGGNVLCTGFAPQGQSARIEICYNTIKTAQGVAAFALESATTSVWYYRNSLYNTSIEMFSPTTGGPYLIEQNAIMSNQSPIVETGSQVTISGTECHGTLSAGILDSTTLALTGSFRTSYLGTRGAEIA